VLDGGVHATHIDIAPNLDVAHSTSFVPGQAFNTDVGTFWHGTHVAGIVAAAANDIGTAGIAPEATIISVKVLHNGTGSFSQVIAGIYYAATPIAEGGAGANIINMSLGAVFSRKEPGGKELEKAMSAATKYARKRGVLVIASTGNDALDLDGDVVSVPAQSIGVVGISALGPLGWGQDPSVSLDRVASYTNYGHRAVGLAGPGGDFVLPGEDVCSRPRLPTGTVLQLCWALDMVMSTTRGSGASIGSYGWAAGTSMAAPAAAGGAALIVGKYGPMDPAQLEARLRQSADDLGKPGRDDFYGQGRINAWRAVSQ
jgi:subtilisin family serine protease